MSECSDGLHFDGVALVERVIEDTWGINDLPSGVLVVGVTHVQTLSRERVRLHVDVCFGDVVHEAGLADVRVARDDERPIVGVDLGQTGHVFPDLLEVAEGRLEFLEHGAYSAECGLLELLSSV